MSSFDLREVEFQSDGVADSLTLTMAPALFHENLKREIANAKRENRDLAVLSIVLRPDRFTTVAEFQEGLIALAFALRTSLRGGDFFARISDCGFWVLLRTAELDADLIVKRLDLPRHDDLESYIVARKYDEYTQWIERLDQLHFQ
jgi:GGDEF domain-containing protein